MKNELEGPRTLLRGKLPRMAIMLLASSMALPGCAWLAEPGDEAGWRFGRIVQVGVADTPFQAAALDCRTQPVTIRLYALVKLGASGAQSRRTIVGPSAPRHVIVPLASNNTLRLNDIVRVHMADCMMPAVRA